MSAEHALTEIWYGKSSAAVWLQPLASLYGAVTATRRLDRVSRLFWPRPAEGAGLIATDLHLQVTVVRVGDAA